MIRDFFLALSAFGRALQLTSRLGLWPYYWAPVLISLLLAGLIGVTAWTVSDNIAGWLIAFYPFSWGTGVVERVAQVFGGLLVAATGVILFKNLVMALAGPFMSFLSEKVERELAGQQAPTMSLTQAMHDLVRGLRIALRLIIRELFFTLILVVPGVVPVFTPLVAVFIFIIQAYYAGFGNMDFTLERHFSVRDSVQFVRRNRGLAIGNGVVYLLLFLTGIGFLVALPLATIAAGVVTVDRIADEK